MSKTARTPYITKKEEKRKDMQAARAVKNSVSDAAELWIAPNKQFCLKPSLEYSSLFTENGRNFECRQRWRRSDIGRQTVPVSVIYLVKPRVCLCSSSDTVTRNVTVLKHFLSFPELTISRTMYIQEIPSPPPSVY